MFTHPAHLNFGIRQKAFYKGLFFRFVPLFTLLSSTMPLHADGIIAILKNSSTIERRGAANGSYKGSISVNNALDVGCDGETIAVLLGNGTVQRYNAQTGAYQGSISIGGSLKAVQVSGGVIAVTTQNSVNLYNAKTGAYMGSSSR